MSDAPDSTPVPPDSPALLAAQQALDAVLADQGPEQPDPADPENGSGDPENGSGDPENGSGDPTARLAERATRLAQAQQALAALLDEEPPSPRPADDAEA